MRKSFNAIVLYVLFVSSVATANQETSHTHLSEVAAIGNDWLISKGQDNTLLMPFTWITSRGLSTVLFPVCTAVDMALLTVDQVKEVPQILLDKDPDHREQHLAQYQENTQELKKKTLGLLATPFSLLSPDIVTHHFIPKNTPTSRLAPGGKLYSSYAYVAHPRSTFDVQEIVLEARNAGKSISVLGKSMSQGKQAISNDDWNIAIDTSNLNSITIDTEAKIARVGAGASWADLQREANHFGLAVRVMQASNIFSIGGSISVNCHGWDHHTGSLCHTLLAMTVVDAMGNILQLTPKDELFHYIVGGYGGFGVVVDATLSLTDNVKMLESGVEVTSGEYVNYFRQHICNHDDIDMHLYRLSLEPRRLFRTGIAVNYYRVGEAPVVADLIDEPGFGRRYDRIKLHTVRRLSWLRDLAWNVEKRNALDEKISSRNELMRPPINSILNNSRVDAEWLQEYFVKEEDLVEFLGFLGGILQENHVGVLNASVRFVKRDANTKLSYAQDGDRFAIVLFFNQKLSTKEIQKTQAWVRQVIDFLIDRGGTYYLPYQHFATLDQFRACYPHWTRAASFKQDIDPDRIFDNGFFADYLTPGVVQESLIRRVFSRVDGNRDEMRDFLNHVFMQLNEKEFFALVDSILEDRTLNDEQIYQVLYENISKAQPNSIWGIRQTLKALNSLKSELGDLTAQLVGQRPVNGYVEIGYPGRMTRPLKNRLSIQGPLYVIQDEERLTDYVEAGFPRPYDFFVPLNDYEPISQNEIPTASVDLVCLYIGLHHAPEEKLDAFVDSIKRILRPGGSFILMDHDAYTHELQDFVDVVHSVFNAATGVELSENSQEIRNFHSLQYWINRVEAHGLVYDHSKPLVRQGDSTLNALIRFERPQTDRPPEVIVESLMQDPNYFRSQMQTYLTAPEWQNVRAAQRYAAFLEEQPAYRYPYFSEISSFWSVYGQAWKAAQQDHTFFDIALADYNLMNLFVGTGMTLEYGIKGLLAAPFALYDLAVPGGRESSDKSPADQERIRALKEYGAYIETTPFYEYPYFKDIGSYWSTYLTQEQSLVSGIKGLVVGTGMTLENTLKGIISAPLSYLYGSTAFKEAQTIHFLIYDPDDIVQSLDSEIVVLDVFPEHHLKHLEVPRYIRFTELMQQIAQHPSLACLNIAGHKKIQIDVQSPQPFVDAGFGARILYEIPVPTDKQHWQFALELDVDQLFCVMRTLKQDNVRVLFIHDY